MKNLPVFFSIFLFASCSQPVKKEQRETIPKPNILLIVADDLGYSDIQPFGGNINTPVLQQFSKESMLFSNYHVQPTCSPTRASLLTGNDNHVAGLGIMEEVNYPELDSLNLPGYAGYLSNLVVTLPELLKDAGYHTYMTGKWHLGEGMGKDPFYRGFEETFILGTGGGSHFNDYKALAPLQHMDYTRNGKQAILPDNFYSSDAYTDSLLMFIDQNKSDKKPFFAYLSYTAVHDPLQAPKDYIAGYKGRFDMGWDSLWTLRLKNLQQLGIISNDVKKFSKNQNIKNWNTLDKEHQKELARDMEVYAGMLEYMDMCIGKVIDYLKANNLYENTMIVFMSDNGANGALATTYPGNGDGKYLSSFDNSMENRGLKNSYVEMGPGWAQASSAPFRFFKSFTTEGGIRAPLMIKLPETNSNGKWSKTFVHVTDLMPTILELTGVSYVSEYKGNKIHPLIGKSILPVLKSVADNVHGDSGMGWELFEMKAYIKGNWKILRLPPPLGSGNWELYDLNLDPAETTDLSLQHPDIKGALVTAWNEYAKVNDLHDHRGHYDEIYRKSYSSSR